MNEVSRLDALKAWRMAVKGKALPFYVMPDHVLHAIVEANPTTLEELAKVPGLGPKRMHKYGESLMALLKRYP